MVKLLMFNEAAAIYAWQVHVVRCFFSLSAVDGKGDFRCPTEHSRSEQLFSHDPCDKRQKTGRFLSLPLRHIYIFVRMRKA